MLLAACGSSHPASPAATSGTTPPAAAAGGDSVVIKNFAFHPANLTVAPGARVTVHNEDSATHTLSASGSPPAFTTGNIAPGAVVTFTAPRHPGQYPYICDIHQFMHGTLTVS